MMPNPLPPIALVVFLLLAPSAQSAPDDIATIDPSELAPGKDGKPPDKIGTPLADPSTAPASLAFTHPKAGGFRGIWFDLGQKSKFGSKYSGGLGTYTANHVPMAHYVPEVNRTYLTWGGTTAANERKLLILVSYFDHHTGLVARPVVVMDKTPVNDPHDNASMSIDEEGYIWIFVSGRGTTRLGRIYRSKVPYGIDDWINLGDSEFTYPQPWWFPGKGFLHTYTRYTAGRELYCRTSRNGTTWNAEKKLSGIGGHYQTSHQVGDRVITAFNRHPSGNVDARTDLYYMETPDMGTTWTAADGTVLTTPLTTVANPARIRNLFYQFKNPLRDARVPHLATAPGTPWHEWKGMHIARVFTMVHITQQGPSFQDTGSG